MKQNDIVLQELQSGRALTSLDCVKLGILRLGARVYDLRQLGYDVKAKTIAVKSRYGIKYVAQYSLKVGGE